MVEECKEGLKENLRITRGMRLAQNRMMLVVFVFSVGINISFWTVLFDYYHIKCGMESKKQVLNISRSSPGCQPMAMGQYGLYEAI